MPVPKPGEAVVIVEEMAPQPEEVAGPMVAVDPVDSRAVFVDFASFNTKVYYVLGDVGVPGRLPFTGKETVLDALNYVGGLVPTGEPNEIHLYRPASGGKPAKDYKIDHEAILKGVTTANLQIFPNDRLVIGRNPIVKKTMEVDRANSLFNSFLNTMLQYSFTVRSLAAINTPPGASGTSNANMRVNGQNMPLNLADPAVMTPAQRDAMVKEWVDFFWTVSASARDGGAMLDEKAFREALMKKLAPTPTPEPK
jgi:SLBB domain